MFYSQPISTRFGTDLINNIGSGTWTKLDIAVAWVRQSGIAHLEPVLKSFLNLGGELNIVVGVDLNNTTKEGLESLIQLEKYGKASTFVHHNESGTVFHPKLYLFRNLSEARLIVGSNNITEAGLFRNTEAGLQLDASIDDQKILDAVNAMHAWRDPSLGLARQLDAAFLLELATSGYVTDEAAARAEIAAKRAARGGRSDGKKKLFGTVAVSAPTKPVTEKIAAPSQKTTNSNRSRSAVDTDHSKTTAISNLLQVAHGQVLLMRVRKARGTQVQIPLAVMKTPFFKGASEVRSVLSDVRRGIHPTHPKGDRASDNPNTLKLEMPETRSMDDPVARFERTPLGIQYEVYDSSSAKGAAIMQALEQGRLQQPPITFLTVPSNPSSATWWRFI